MLWVRISFRARCTTLCDKICLWLATGRWLSPGPPVSWPPRYNWNIVESGWLLNTIKQTNTFFLKSWFYWVFISQLQQLCTFVIMSRSLCLIYVVKWDIRIKSSRFVNIEKLKHDSIPHTNSQVITSPTSATKLCL